MRRLSLLLVLLAGVLCTWRVVGCNQGPHVVAEGSESVAPLAGATGFVVDAAQTHTQEKPVGESSGGKGAGANLAVQSDAPMQDSAEVAGPALWRDRYSALTSEELRGRSDEMLDYIAGETEEEIARRFRAGEYEIIANDGAFAHRPGDAPFIKGLDSVRISPDGEVQKVSLPEDEYAELYSIGREAHWMREQAKVRGKKGSVLPGISERPK